MDISQNLEEKQKVELFIQCRSLKDMDTFSKSDPQVILYVRDNKKQQWAYFGKTEIIWDNLNPNFVQTFVIDYHFEKQQNLKFKVVDIDDEKNNQYDFIGDYETTLGSIVGSKNSTQIFQLKDEKQKNSGKLIVRAESVKQSKEYLNFQFQGKQLRDTRFLFGKTCPFLRIYRVNEGTSPLLVYQTEVAHNNLNPIFKPKLMNLGKLCNGDQKAPILCELWDYHKNGSHKNLGSFQFSVEQFLKYKTEKMCFQVKDKGGKFYGYFMPTMETNLKIRHNFLDYIKGGTQLALINAVDFTASNGHPLQHNSLHKIYNNGQQNQYQSAMTSVGQILLDYDHDKMVPMYGFGGRPQYPQLYSDKTLHCFPMTGNKNDTEVYGLQGMLDTYQNSIQCVQFHGPTLFAPIIKETMGIADNAKLAQNLSQDDDQYFILLILTDGEIHDMEDTKRCIVDSSHLPLSIIIIGVGDADFTNMEILDGDEGLWDNQGRKAKRDLVQFVPFNEYKGNATVLAEQVLQELPQQVEEYMELMKRIPQEPKSQNSSQNFISMGSSVISQKQNNIHPQNQSYNNITQSTIPSTQNQSYQQVNNASDKRNQYNKQFSLQQPPRQYIQQNPQQQYQQQYIIQQQPQQVNPQQQPQVVYQQPPQVVSNNKQQFYQRAQSLQVNQQQQNVNESNIQQGQLY